MKKCFLLIDYNKNALLFTFDELNSYKSFSEIVNEKIKNKEVKEHKTRADLNKTVSEYLRGRLEPGGNDNGT